MWSCGQELYPNRQGGSAVFNDTNTLITNVRNGLNASQWKSGNCALFSSSCRAYGPYSIFQDANHHDATMPNPAELTDFGASIVAYKFNIHHLHFSKMTSFTAYLRVWAPSLLNSNNAMFPDNAILISGGYFNDVSKLKVKFFKDIPNPSWDVSDSGDAFEFGGGNSNNGTVVTRDTLLQDKAACYCPFGRLRGYNTDFGNLARIYTLQDNGDTPPPRPTNYYHDFQLSNTDNLNFLKKNPGEMWVVAHFHVGNTFSQGGTTQNGLAPQHGALVFAERVELLFKCNSSRFNY